MWRSVLFSFGCALFLMWLPAVWQGGSRPLKPARQSRVLTVQVVFLCVQVNERGGAREEREEQRKQNGGLHEEEASKQHRKPERTLRCTDTNNTNKVTAWFSLWGQNSHEIFKQLCFPQNQILTICVIICCQERNLNNFICFILSHRVTSTNIHVLGQNKYSIFSLLHFSIFYHSDLKHSQRLQPVVFWLLIHLPVISYFYFIFSSLLLLFGLKYLANYYSITKMFSDYFVGSPVILFQL